MPKLEKPKLKKHIVVVDTNILFPEDKDDPVNPVFDEFWEEHSQIADLELHIPEVVLGELLFQQTNFAWTLYDKADNALKKASTVTKKNIGIRIDRETLSGHVEKKLNAWISKKKGEVIKTPHLKKNQWSEMVTKSIWRLPPFEPYKEGNNSENRKTEKGFRDAVILSTLLSKVENERRDVQIVFITGDKLLLKTATDALSLNERCSCFEGLEDFSSHIRMMRVEKDKAFVDAILPKASDKFFTNKDIESLYFKFCIRDELNKKYMNYIETPELIDSSDSNAFGVLNLFEDTETRKKWSAKGKGSYWVGKSQFDKIEGERIYCWKTRVTYIALFERDSSSYRFAELLNANKYQILILPCKVLWKAEVRANGRFFKPELDKIDYESGAFREPTDEEVRKYNLSRNMED